ncbi:MAG: hypothetical protein PUP91_13805 [Rhizonema sp. PD37]|nr:hypothetical protein [Rhizonema sp. PD37]
MLTTDRYQSVFIPDLDLQTPKTELAELMGLHRNTLTKWHKWVKIIIPDYKIHCNESPFLSQYQCWVLGEVYRISLQLKRKNLIAKYIRDHRDEYSFTSFNQIYRKIA